VLIAFIVSGCARAVPCCAWTGGCLGLLFAAACACTAHFQLGLCTGWWQHGDLTHDQTSHGHTRRVRNTFVPLWLLQFVVIAFITSADAIEHLANHKEPENGALIIVFAVITMLVLGAIGCMKLYINRHLHSKALEQVQAAAAGLG
jgi:hypothetical protein